MLKKLTYDDCRFFLSWQALWAAVSLARVVLRTRRQPRCTNQLLHGVVYILPLITLHTYAGSKALAELVRKLGARFPNELPFPLIEEVFKWSALISYLESPPITSRSWIRIEEMFKTNRIRFSADTNLPIPPVRGFAVLVGNRRSPAPGRERSSKVRASDFIISFS